MIVRSRFGIGPVERRILASARAKNLGGTDERIGSGSEGFTASPVSDGRHLYLTSEVGNVYVADTGNHTIRKLTTLTYAGWLLKHAATTQAMPCLKPSIIMS